MNKVQQDRHMSSDDIAKELKIEHQMVLNHLEKIGYRKKFDVWVPYDSKLCNSFERISICEALLKRNEHEPFLERMITGGAKWITSVDPLANIIPRSAQAKKKKPKKVLLCVWWDWKGVVYHEWRMSDETTDPELYSQQLMSLRKAIRRERPELMDSNVVYQHDNTRPFTCISSRRKLEEFGWEVLMHPSHSPDITPSDYHLFPSLPNSFLVFELMGVGWLKRLFNQKPQSFYNQGIMTLPEKWQKVIDQNGDYLEEQA